MAPEFTSLGERELEVMAVLWAIGSGTVAEVRERLEVPLAYTTVLTILRNLEAKQYVSREEEGRAHRYFPRVAQRAAQQSALSRLVSSLFGGSPEALVARLVEQEQLTPQELAQLARALQGPAAAAPVPALRTAGEDTVPEGHAAPERPVPGTRPVADPSSAASPYRGEDAS